MAIRMAVIGAGRIGQIHASNAARNPGVSLAGVADAITEPAAKLAAQLSTNVVSVEQIFADRTIDAVLIGLLIWFNLICRMLLLTSSWIATGQDPELGLPARQLEQDPLSQAAHAQ